MDIGTVIDPFLPPVAILALLLLGVLFWRRPSVSRGFFAVATLLFTLASLPGVAGLLSLPLIHAAPHFDSETAGPAPFDAILVPTGGSFQDESGAWWPTRLSIERGVAAQRLQSLFALPLIVAGGQPLGDGPSEAEILTDALDLSGGDLRLETRAKNSAETAVAVAGLLTSATEPKVILVTSPLHVARMSAVLRRQGVTVAAHPAPAAALKAYTELAEPGQWLPSSKGLGRTRAVLWEYLGIYRYLWRGDLRYGDLLPSS